MRWSGEDVFEQVAVEVVAAVGVYMADEIFRCVTKQPLRAPVRVSAAPGSAQRATRRPTATQ